MASFIELIAKIKPKNNGKYALIDDVDVEMEDGSRLSEAIKKPKITNGGKKGQLLAKKSDNDGDAEWIDSLKIEDVDKKLEGKLDKNLGLENSDKILSIDSKGDIIPQNKPSINDIVLDGNKSSGDLKMYTQEEVNSLLEDKMDKPYVPIEITDDTTIDNCLPGKLKINSIEGKTYQKVETDIVPTPERPVPINSRKIPVLRDGPNVFPLEQESDTSKITDIGNGRDVYIKKYTLEPDTIYDFSWTEETIPPNSVFALSIKDEADNILTSYNLTFSNFTATEVTQPPAEESHLLITPSNGVVKFCYTCNISGYEHNVDTYKKFWYTNQLKGISLKAPKSVKAYKELRSLKETINMFDFRHYVLLNSEFFALTDDGLGMRVLQQEFRDISVIPYELDLPPNQYLDFMWSGGAGQNIRAEIYIKVEGSDVWQEAGIIQDGTEKQTLGIGNDKNIKMKFKFIGPPSAEKINIGLYSYSNSVTNYIPPTVRDYKIVDHDTQTSKIVRNVKNIRVTPIMVSNGFNDYNETIKRALIITSDRFVIDNVTRAGDELSNVAITIREQQNNSNTFMNISGIELIYWYPDISMLGLNGSESKDVASQKLVEFLTNNEMYVQYQLATPTEESIPYFENDTSEVGLSWQDTTSPSLTIPSDIKGVDKVDITVTGKNLFDINGNVNSLLNGTQGNKNSVENGVLTTNYNSAIETLGGQLIRVVIGMQYTISFNVLSIGDGSGVYLAVYKNNEVINMPNIPLGTYKLKITANTNEILLAFGATDGTGAKIENIQIEEASVATTYEPYTEQHINTALLQPLYRNDIANVENGGYEYCTKNITIDFNRFEGRIDMIQEHTIRYLFHKSSVQEFDGIILDTLLFDRFRKINDDSDTVHFKIGGINNEYVFMYIPKNYTNDITYAKEYLSSLNLIANFAVETKTEIPIPEEDLAKLKSLKTEQGVTNIFVGGEVKPIIEARYPQDVMSAVNKLQTKLLTLQEEVVKNV